MAKEKIDWVKPEVPETKKDKKSVNEGTFEIPDYGEPFFEVPDYKNKKELIKRLGEKIGENTFKKITELQGSLKSGEITKEQFKNREKEIWEKVGKQIESSQKDEKPEDEKPEEGFWATILKFFSTRTREAKKQEELAQKLGVKKDENIVPEVGKEAEAAQEQVEKAVESGVQGQSEKIKEQVEKLSPEKKELFDRIKGLAGNKKVQLALGIGLLGTSVFAGGLPILTGMTIGQFLFGKALLVGTEAALAGTAAGYAGAGIGGILIEKFFRKHKEEKKEIEKQTEIKSGETKPKETKPEETKPGETKQEEIKPEETEEKPVRTNVDTLEDFSEEDKEKIQDALTKARIQGAEVEDYDWEKGLEKEKQKETTTEERIIEEAKNKAGRIQQDRSKFFTGDDDLDAPEVPEFLKDDTEKKKERKEENK
jgi:hypothetical protein